MQTKRLVAPFALAALVLAGQACSNTGHTGPSRSDEVARGARLAAVGACGDCHTPKKLDPDLKMPVPQMDRALSGHPEGAPDPVAAPAQGDQAVIGASFTAFATGFGTVYAQNLTPDPETGLGTWTAETFIRAMRTGRHAGRADGRPILPPMPWMALGQQSDEDLTALFTYLQTLPPVRNRVPEPRVSPEALAAISHAYDEARRGAR